MADRVNPQWDGEYLNGRPVAHCQECGALRYAEDIEYIGEAALGGPNFSYRMGEAARPLLDVERLAAAMDTVWPGWSEESPGTEEAHQEMLGYATDLAAEYTRLAFLDPAPPPEPQP